MPKHTIMPVMVSIILLTACTKTGSNSDCGAAQYVDGKVSFTNFFSHPADIYWGVSGNVRSYTYSWEYDNLCVNQNPKVTFEVYLVNSNSTFSNPFTITAGTYTCLGVQAQKATLTPDASQISYVSSKSEIGMQQCYSGQPSGKIFPYIIISFTTLGSSYKDSLYLENNVDDIHAILDAYQPK
jgi:hypothetical protein